MLFFDDEDIEDGPNIKCSLRLSIQRFLRLHDYSKTSTLTGSEEKKDIFDEIKNEGANIIAYVNKVIKQAKKDCTPEERNTRENSYVRSGESESYDDDRSSILTNEDVPDNNSIFLEIMNDKGLYNSDEEEEEVNSILSVSSSDSIIDCDNAIQCTPSGSPVFRPSQRNSKRRRLRLSSNSSLETVVPQRKHYRICMSDEDEVMEDNLKDPKKVENKPQKYDSKMDKPISKGIELITLSSDEEEEGGGNENPNKYQRKILNECQLIQSTREAKRVNDVYRKEYFQRREDKKIIRYHNNHKDIPYYERRIKSITLDNDKEGSVCVDKAFLKVLKPHQAEGVDFLYYATIRSLEYLDDPGSGGILAHCMGLGKSLQVIVFLQTIFFNPKISKRISKGLLLVPTNVIYNWQKECDYWQSLIEDKAKKFGVYTLIAGKSGSDPHINYMSKIESWINSNRPSILIVGYEMFRNLVTLSESKRCKMDSKKQNSLCTKYCEYLKERPDIVICDEGHKLKNIGTQLAIAVNSISTKRRICLTGTPIQNNLREYFTMINFVKPSLLGTYKEFSNQFANPIEKGIKIGASYHDVRLMKRRYVVLWKMLDHVLHRRDASFLYSTLPPKEEYIIYCATTTVQIKLLKELIEKFPGNSGFSFKSNMSYICTHPSLLSSKTNGLPNEDDISDLENISTRKEISEWSEKNELIRNTRWNNFEISSKLVILFEIIRYAEKIGEKVLVFAQYRKTIKYIEKALKYLAENNLWYGENHTHCQNSTGKSWKLYKDYFVITGDTPLGERSFVQNRINMRRTKSGRARLVLMTTKASSLGTNFIGANRVVIFEPGFNPSDDLQALHRVYRMGQMKPTFIYRLVAQGTIEERIQERQIIKDGISRCSIDKHHIRDLYDDDSTQLSKLNCIDVSDPSYCRETLPKPNDDLLSNLIIKNPKRIINYAVYDSLLENKVDEELTEEEKEKEWEDFIRQEGLTEEAESISTFPTLSENNVLPLPNVPYLDKLSRVLVPKPTQDK
uniref:Transcriptional regulator ATRX homolog (inferred by orthology to a C. elegans protein) n=1 Tax=Strongyloides venezuelensis TaxID=75913 RepID=A0A0K0FK74_STRVS